MPLTKNNAVKKAWAMINQVIGEATITQIPVAELLKKDYPDFDGETKFIIFTIAVAIESQYAQREPAPFTCGNFGRDENV